MPIDAAQISVSTDRQGNIFFIGEKVELAVKGVGAATSWTVTDFYGKVVSSGSISADGVISPKVKDPGVYYIAFGDPKTRPEGAPLSFCVMRDLPLKGRTSSPFGLNGGGLFHVGLEKVDTEGKDNLDLSARIGAPWGRNDLWWGVIEPKKGQWDWRLADKAVAQYNNHDINLLGILCYASAWYGRCPDSEQEMDNYAEYAYQMVNRYKGKITTWEIWNEPNISIFWYPQPDVMSYTKMLRKAYVAAKKADPNCRIAACVTAGPDIKFIRNVIENGGGDSFDILSVHQYFWNDAGFLNDLKALQELLKSYGLNKPIWITEIGWPTGKKWMSQEEQANRLVRVFTLAVAGGVERLFYFNSVDWVGWDNEGWDGRIGLCDTDETPKASCVAYNTLMWQLDDAKPAGNIYIGPESYGRLFSKGNERIAVLWTTGKDRTVKLDIDQPVKSIDIMGRETLLKPKDGTVAVKLTQSPVFIRTSGSSLDRYAGLDFSTSEMVRGCWNVACIKAATPQDAARLVPSLPKGWEWRESEKRGDGRIIEIRVPQTVKAGDYEIKLLDGTTQLLSKGVKVIEHISVNAAPPAKIVDGNMLIPVTLSNRSPHILSGTVTGTLAGKAVGKAQFKDLKPESSQEVILPVAMPSAVWPQVTEIDIKAVSGDSIGTGKVTVRPMLCRKVSDKPVLDGNLSEWESVPAVMNFGEGKAVGLGGKWEGVDDLSARAWLSWDADNVYMAIDVRDDKNVLPEGPSVWDWDSVQIGLDMKNDATTSGYDEDNDFELEVGFVKGEPKAYLAEHPKGTPVELPTDCIKVTPKADGKGVLYELRLPASIFRAPNYAVGDTFGFSFIVNDNDGSGRKSFLEMTPGIGLGKDPSEFVDVVLTE